MLGHESAPGMYQTNFLMMQMYHYSLSDIEAMYPFEREIYITLLNKYIQQQNQAMEAAQQKQKG